jgi:hypothetical protein
LLASEGGKDIEFSAETLAALRTEFQSIVEQIVRETAEKKAGSQLGGEPTLQNDSMTPG